MPSYEVPVETAKDLIDRNIIPFITPGSEMYRQLFAASSDPIYQEISRRLVVAKDWDEFGDMMGKVTSTGMYARIGSGYKDWYRSTETIVAVYPYTGHLTNKKWPLKKVLLSSIGIVQIIY